MTGQQKQDFTLRITQANETEMVVLLYEILLCYLEEAKEALEKPFDGTDECLPDGFKESVRKSRNCIHELLASVDIHYAPGVELNKLYFFCLRQLAQGLQKRDAACIETVRNIIGRLHKAYLTIAPQNEHEPVMSNSQTVYTGMTYGKNSLSQSLTDTGAGRGILV